VKEYNRASARLQAGLLLATIAMLVLSTISVAEIRYRVAGRRHLERESCLCFLIADYGLACYSH
jgi:hypothetical protein